MGETVAPCPPIQAPADAAQRHLWQCAGEATDLAFWSLIFVTVALLGINATLLWYRLWRIQNL